MKECPECGSLISEALKTLYECPKCGWTRMKTKQERKKK